MTGKPLLGRRTMARSAIAGLLAGRSVAPLPARAAVEDVDVAATPPVATRHTGSFNGQHVDYLATAGRSPLPGPDGAIIAQIFYVAYTKVGAPAEARPITFAVNGGPGAATAWLHLGALGPRKVALRADGTPPPPPARLVDNPLSPLDKTDLVFIDTPGTGYSRVVDDQAKDRLFDAGGDVDALVTFIKSHLTANERWGSPVHLFGESYGGTRVGALSDALVQAGVPVSGMVLLSAALDFLLLNPSMINDLPFIMLIPSYACIAAFHGKLAPTLPNDREALIRTAQDWALGDYARALARGDLLPLAERETVIARLADLTGLARGLVDRLDLRIDAQTYMKELLADRHLVTGRVDGRLTGPQPLNSVQEPWYDPAMGALTPAYSAATEQYLESTLRYRSPIPYRMYSRDVDDRFVMAEAQKDDGAGGYPQSLSSLQSALVKNADLRVLLIGGIYDLASPFWTTEYEIAHLRLPDAFRRNIRVARLPAGHMVYDDPKGLHDLSALVSEHFATMP